MRNNDDYKETYKPLFLWGVVFTFFDVGATLLMHEWLNISSYIISKLTLIIAIVAFEILVLMMYKTQYIYWINGGPTYQEAKDGGSAKRKRYAKRHLSIFNKCAVINAVYFTLSFIFKLNFWLDVTIVTVSLIVAACMTIPIKFDDDKHE